MHSSQVARDGTRNKIKEHELYIVTRPRQAYPRRTRFCAYPQSQSEFSISPPRGECNSRIMTRIANLGGCRIELPGMAGRLHADDLMSSPGEVRNPVR